VTGGPSWDSVKAVFQAALDYEPARRAAFVREACGDDHGLRREVESLLAAFEQADGFVERSALQSVSASAARAAVDALGGATSALRPGETFGPYRVLELEGAGGMGEVYRARDSKLNRDVALKVRSAAFALDQEHRARVAREAHVLASLNHPNIAAIYSLEEHRGVQAIILEHVEGPTLADRIAHGPIPVAEAMPIAAQIARGLAAAHQRGIVHRDLKPANVKLRPDGTVKILDFGIAKTQGQADASPAPEGAALAAASMTRAGLVFGTAAYTSPEQARGKAVDKRTDIWAFGCVLF
jgi:serine/threonine protein kinase